MLRLIAVAIAVLGQHLLGPNVSAQTDDRPSSSLSLTPQAPADVTLSFDIKGDGRRFAPLWGLDQAWINEQNLRKGMNHMGKDNISVGRSAFRTNLPLVNDSVLQSDQTQKLRQRANMFDIVDKALPLILTADQEAGSDAYFVQNRSADVDHWAANINSHVHWLQQNTQHPVIGVSPFNEPDYWTVEEGATTAKHAQVAQILKEHYPRFADIAIVGGNTLNDDKAWTWFNAGKDYYDWGNTHQLAGSMANYISFHQQLAQLGKTGYNDEMHNVAEAMIGLEYGMTVGVWWGFDSRARGEFCDISRHGERLAYAEHRNNWTAASVYRHDDGRVKAFIGSSERQAYTTTFQFLSPDRDVYYDGHGPLRNFAIEMPGGTAYQTGQTNAERVVDITWGDDVQPMPITEGVYKIVNKVTGNVVAVNNSSITQQKWTGADRQLWNIKPCSPRIGGDYSFYDLSSRTDATLRIDVKNFSTYANAELIAYQDVTPKSNQLWYIEYAGDGYYYIRNRESALYMASAGTMSTNNVRVTQTPMQTGDARGKLLWRTGLGHGDATHLSDFDPDNEGMEVFIITEETEAQYDAALIDAKTGNILVGKPQTGGDTARGLALDCDSKYDGAEFMEMSDANLMTSKGEVIAPWKAGSVGSSSINYAIYWDGDLLREYHDRSHVDKWNATSKVWDRICTLYQFGYGANSVNSTKYNPNLQCDLYGDWREEVVYWAQNNGNYYLTIFTTTTESQYKLPWLRDDHTYDMAIVWQNCGYNQPPHLGYSPVTYYKQLKEQATAIRQVNNTVSAPRYYDLMGRPLTNPNHSGIFIEQLSDGTSRIIHR